MPGGTTTSPSGLSSSLATLAMNFEVPTPTDAVRPPVTSATCARSRSAKAVTVAISRSSSCAAARSTKASSSDSGSTSGEVSRSTAITCSLAVR